MGFVALRTKRDLQHFTNLQIFQIPNLVMVEFSKFKSAEMNLEAFGGVNGMCLIQYFGMMLGNT